MFCLGFVSWGGKGTRVSFDSGFGDEALVCNGDGMED